MYPPRSQIYFSRRHSAQSRRGHGGPARNFASKPPVSGTSLAQPGYLRPLAPNLQLTLHHSTSSPFLALSSGGLLLFVSRPAQLWRGEDHRISGRQSTLSSPTINAATINSRPPAVGSGDGAPGSSTRQALAGSFERPCNARVETLEPLRGSGKLHGRAQHPRGRCSGAWGDSTGACACTSPAPGIASRCHSSYSTVM